MALLPEFVIRPIDRVAGRQLPDVSISDFRRAGELSQELWHQHAHSKDIPVIDQLGRMLEIAWKNLTEAFPNLIRFATGDLDFEQFQAEQEEYLRSRGWLYEPVSLTLSGDLQQLVTRVQELLEVFFRINFLHSPNLYLIPQDFVKMFDSNRFSGILYHAGFGSAHVGINPKYGQFIIDLMKATLIPDNIYAAGNRVFANRDNVLERKIINSLPVKWGPQEMGIYGRIFTANPYIQYESVGDIQAAWARELRGWAIFDSSKFSDSLQKGRNRWFEVAMPIPFLKTHYGETISQADKERLVTRSIVRVPPVDPGKTVNPVIVLRSIALFIKLRKDEPQLTLDQLYTKIRDQLIRIDGYSVKEVDDAIGGPGSTTKFRELDNILNRCNTVINSIPSVIQGVDNTILQIIAGLRTFESAPGNVANNKQLKTTASLIKSMGIPKLIDISGEVAKCGREDLSSQVMNKRVEVEAAANKALGTLMIAAADCKQFTEVTAPKRIADIRAGIRTIENQIAAIKKAPGDQARIDALKKSSYFATASLPSLASEQRKSIRCGRADLARQYSERINWVLEAVKNVEQFLASLEQPPTPDLVEPDIFFTPETDVIDYDDETVTPPSIYTPPPSGADVSLSPSVTAFPPITRPKRKPLTTKQKKTVGVAAIIAAAVAPFFLV